MLNTLAPAKGSMHKRKRRGRGNASGKGTYSGRGVKGQLSRSGRPKGAQFEGGQTPLIRRQPKRGGFRNPNREEYEVVNIGDLNDRLETGAYDLQALKEARLVHGKLPVKLLGRGKVSKKFSLTVDSVSRKAKEAIEKAGGTVTLA